MFSGAIAGIRSPMLSPVAVVEFILWCLYDQWLLIIFLKSQFILVNVACQAGPGPMSMSCLRILSDDSLVKYSRCFSELTPASCRPPTQPPTVQTKSQKFWYNWHQQSPHWFLQPRGRQFFNKLGRSASISRGCCSSSALLWPLPPSVSPLQNPSPGPGPAAAAGWGSDLS